MNKFPSIDQFRHAVRAERDAACFEGREPGVRRYVGTVKLHGTNAGIEMSEDGTIRYLSRSRIIKPGDDNAGFATHMSNHEDAIEDILQDIGGKYCESGKGETVTIFGEWCGQGIQKGVGINSQEKMFVVFAILAGGRWLSPNLARRNLSARIFNVCDFQTWEMDIDFSRPELAQNKLIDLTMAVEAECPVAKSFGYSGIGEGVVWKPADGDQSSKYWFKVKGEKHSTSKVAILAEVDVEAFRKKDELVAAIVTTARLEQGLELQTGLFGRKLEMPEIGHFLRWVFNDVIKEESDRIEASGFQGKELGKPISDIAKRFYMKALDAADLQMNADLDGLAA